MNAALLEQELGSVDPQSLHRAYVGRRVAALSYAPHVLFNGGDSADDGVNSDEVDRDSKTPPQSWAHKSGAQHFVIEQQESRYAISGGADASIHLWDLGQAGDVSQDEVIHRPIDSVPKGPDSHKYGITCITFYPVDPGLFVTSSYDNHVKIYDTNTLECSASFDVQSKVFSHHMSPIADNDLVATASYHPAIRLIDLRSGSTMHSLVGHNGAVYSVAWSPRDEFILASGGQDGTLRLWDIRKSASCVGLLDLEDSTGTFGIDGRGTAGVRSRFTGKAHLNGCNGLSWSEEGTYLVSAGHDERIRVWDISLGRNDLSHFGPYIRNKKLNTVLPLPLPRYQTQLGQRLMLFPNDGEILMFDMFEGTLIKRLRIPGASVAQSKGGSGQRHIVSRITSLAWRRHHQELYSSQSDGSIRAWIPVLPEDDDDETPEDEQTKAEDDDLARKRKALDDIYQSFMKKKTITFQNKPARRD